MGETRDGWSKAEVIIGAIGALGSIAIPIMLFVVGNRIAERQAEDSAAQLQADRVERMLGHLASTNADERRLAVNVVRYFSGTAQAFPEDLIPLLIEVASADPKEDVAATASGALEKLAQGGQGAAAAEAAKVGLRKIPAAAQRPRPARGRARRRRHGDRRPERRRRHQATGGQRRRAAAGDGAPLLPEGGPGPGAAARGQAGAAGDQGERRRPVGEEGRPVAATELRPGDGEEQPLAARAKRESAAT